MKTVLTILLRFLVFSTGFTSLRAELKFVQILFRHGDRSPTKDYPTDPNSPKWPDGLKQLTTIGMQQEYELGGWLRSRYRNFTGERYSPLNVYYQSDDMDRTLMSAEAQLAGFFPPTEDQRFNNMLNWHPIPVHTISLPTDTLLYDPECPNYDKRLNEVHASDEVQKVIDETPGLFEHISANAGMIINATNIDNVFDPGFCERNHNMTQPDWYNETIFQQVQRLHVFDWHWQFIDRTMTRLKVGVLINTLIAKMKEAMTVDKVPKFIGYSGHDTNIVGLLHALNVWNNRAPPFATCMMFELSHDKEANRWSVNVLLRNSTQAEPYQLAIPGCDNSECTLEQFEQILSDVSMPAENWTNECGNATQPSGGDGQFSVTITMAPGLFAAIIAVWALLGVFGLVFIFYVGYRCYSRRYKKNEYRQHLLQYQTMGNDNR